VLGPHDTAGYVLTIGDTSSMPGNDEPFVLQAVSGSPLTISSSPRFVEGGPVSDD